MIGTFHGIAHRLLRAHHLDAGPAAGFPDPRLRRPVPPHPPGAQGAQPRREALGPARRDGLHQRQEGRGLRPGDIDLYGDPVTRTYQQIYKTYQETCDRSGLVDFAELLLRAHELWLNKPHILEHYRDRFQNILVDEFQDTNGIQYAWLRMLAGDTGKVMIVGDDDQSIYGWRGAKIENIQRFRRLSGSRRPSARTSRTAPPPISSKLPTASSPTTLSAWQGAVDRRRRRASHDFALRRLQRGG